MNFRIGLAVMASLLAAPAAFAADQTIVVTPPSGLPGSTNWGTIPTENTGTISITAAAPRSGDGSIEIVGDRTRFQLGIQYAGPFQTNLMPLSSVTGLAFDWRIAGDSISGYNPDYTPALRLLVQDGSQRSELIWEGAYNGTYGNTARDTWYSSSFDDLFYQNIAGSGVTLVNGAQVNKSLTAWIADNYSANAFVTGISVGAGSGALATYHAFVDNVRLRSADGVTTYNFEVAPVPEPASWAMMIGGFGLVGAAMRRRHRISHCAI